MFSPVTGGFRGQLESSTPVLPYSGTPVGGLCGLCALIGKGGGGGQTPTGPDWGGGELSKGTSIPVRLCLSASLPLFLSSSLPLFLSTNDTGDTVRG